MAVQTTTRLREDKLDAGAEAIRKNFPRWDFSREATRHMIDVIIESVDSVPNPERIRARAIVRAAESYLRGLRDNPDAPATKLAYADLEEAVFGPGEVRTWSLKDRRGNHVGVFQGTREEHERLQSSIQ